MAEVVLHLFDVAALGDLDRRGGVAQVVEQEAGGDGLVIPVLPECPLSRTEDRWSEMSAHEVAVADPGRPRAP